MLFNEHKEAGNRMRKGNRMQKKTTWQQKDKEDFNILLKYVFLGIFLITCGEIILRIMR